MSEKKRVSEAHSKKPDPSEPWRYECPDCNGINVRRTNLKGGKRPGETYPMNREGVQRDKSSRYECKDCQKRLTAIIDKKTGELRKP